MLLALSTYHYIIIFSLTIIISYLFNVYSKKTGIPSVLLLIGLGIVINYCLRFMGIEKPNLFPILEVLGVVGLILIVLEAALDLELVKNKMPLITKSFLVALIGLIGTSYVCALSFCYLLDVSLIHALLYTIPLSILSSAIILPSIEDLSEEKKEFMIYESTISDILGIVAFYSVLTLSQASEGSSVYGEMFGNLFLTIIFSVFLSYIIIYAFQNIRGHVKLFLIIAILLLIYAIGKLFHLSSLIMILVFGLILNNYRLFFKRFSSIVSFDSLKNILYDFKTITAESAFVVRTFFFIVFGWSAYLGSLLSLKVIGLGLLTLLIIYVIRCIVLFLFSGKNIFPQLFVAPRGLITILLFFSIPQQLSLGPELQGTLLFVILVSCLIMSWGLISRKNSLSNNVEAVTNEEISKDTENNISKSDEKEEKIEAADKEKENIDNI